MCFQQNAIALDRVLSMNGQVLFQINPMSGFERQRKSMTVYAVGGFHIARHVDTAAGIDRVAMERSLVALHGFFGDSHEGRHMDQAISSFNAFA